jgi:hypothetical protein
MTYRPPLVADQSETTATGHVSDYDLAPGLGAVDELDAPDELEDEVTIGIVPHSRLARRRPSRPKAPGVRRGRSSARGSFDASPDVT